MMRCHYESHSDSFSLYHLSNFFVVYNDYVIIVDEIITKIRHKNHITSIVDSSWLRSIINADVITRRFRSEMATF